MLECTLEFTQGQLAPIQADEHQGLEVRRHVDVAGALLQLLRQRFGLVATRLSSRAWRGRMRSRRDSRHASSCGPCFCVTRPALYRQERLDGGPRGDILADAVGG